MEKHITRAYLYPAIASPLSFHLYTDQYAFRPTGSTDAALIAILHHVSSLLSRNRYVRVIALDFSKAFDTLRHSVICEKLNCLELNDSVYNWFADYFNNHKHATHFGGAVSDYLSINAGVFQGSAVGPPLFLIDGANLNQYPRIITWINMQMTAI